MSRPVPKKHRPALRTFAKEDLCCPITRELFVDPVVASDGIVYERAAIHRWMKVRLQSPITKVRLSPVLYESKIIRRTVETLIKANAVPSELVAEWKANRTLSRGRNLQAAEKLNILCHAYVCTDADCPIVNCKAIKCVLDRMVAYRAQQIAHNTDVTQCSVCKILSTVERASKSRGDIS